MTQTPRKGDFKGTLKSKNIPWEHTPDLPQSFHPQHLYRKSVRIYPRSTPVNSTYCFSCFSCFSCVDFFSRAHTIVGVTFTQKRKNEAGEETAKTSLINLVDLAGRCVIFLSMKFYKLFIVDADCVPILL